MICRFQHHFFVFVGKCTQNVIRVHEVTTFYVSHLSRITFSCLFYSPQEDINM